MFSSIDKATVVTACESNVDVSVTEMDSRDKEAKPDDAKEAKDETPTKTLEKPEDAQLSKGTGTEDEKTKPSEDDDKTKDADKEKPTNHGEDQTKDADKEETTKDGDDQSAADLATVLSDTESKSGKTSGGGRGKQRQTHNRGSSGRGRASGKRQ